MNFAIFGAQGIALGTYESIHKLFPTRKITCFLVTERGDNPEILSGLPVIELSVFSDRLSNEEKDNTEVIIATPENVMDDIEKSLDEHGFHCHVRMTSLRLGQLMSYAYNAGGIFRSVSSLPVGYHKADVHMYMAKFYKDKPLTSDYIAPEWITPIQVGAALCKERVADITDDTGDNISRKNVNYSELTALYWIWKNRLMDDAGYHDEYYGLVHYRRILKFSEDDILRLSDNDVDAVLPYPMPYEPDIEAHHIRYLKNEDWNAVITAVAEVHPEYVCELNKIIKQRYLYNYNIVLARKNVLEKYCDWLFPVLERVEELSIPKGSERADRYIGYVGETLTTVYFMANKENLNIFHAPCRFLI